MELLLNVIRVNEDVIATSMKPTGTCLKVFDYDTNATLDFDDSVKYYKNGSYESSNNYSQKEKTMFENAGITPEFDKYYEIYSDGQKDYLYPCTSHTEHIESCFAKGTKITLVDNSLVNIEDVKEGDSVLTFNHETGKCEGQEVYLAFKGKDLGKSFTLHFSNNNELSIVGEHDLFVKENNKYVTITDENVESFVRKHFYNANDNRYEELLSVTYSDEPIEYYSIYTEHNVNCIANNMLSVPEDVDEFLNIYEFKENLVADEDILKTDLEKYGIFELPAEKFGKEESNYLNVKYINIAIGKGLTSLERLREKRKEYLELTKKGISPSSVYTTDGGTK